MRKWGIKCTAGSHKKSINNLEISYELKEGMVIETISLYMYLTYGKYTIVN